MALFVSRKVNSSNSLSSLSSVWQHFGKVCFPLVNERKTLSACYISLPYPLSRLSSSLHVVSFSHRRRLFLSSHCLCTSLSLIVSARPSSFTHLCTASRLLSPPSPVPHLSAPFSKAKTDPLFSSRLPLSPSSLLKKTLSTLSSLASSRLSLGPSSLPSTPSRLSPPSVPLLLCISPPSATHSKRNQM
uniref:Uncharacterized protein n=1 Tax=Salix viminalis TaxID=40686 RepID=A0A6N2MRQ8_SALVM